MILSIETFPQLAGRERKHMFKVGKNEKNNEKWERENDVRAMEVRNKYTKEKSKEKEREVEKGIEREREQGERERRRNI